MNITPSDLPAGFQFSQSALQDFADCPRRFHLRYIRRLAWPAVETEPALESERFIRQGEAFHHVAHQFFLGIPVESMGKSVQEEPLSSWWTNLLQSIDQMPEFKQPASSRHPEFILSAPWEDYRLIAKYDLLLVNQDQSILIFDWKTYRSRPRRPWLQGRMQTLIYPFLLALAGQEAKLTIDIHPEQISLIYWFANFPTTPEVFTYSARQFQADHGKLSRIVKNIRDLAAKHDQEAFQMTTEVNRCLYCNYRSLCDRGVRAGDLPETAEETPDLDLLDASLEQIAEIEY